MNTGFHYLSKPPLGTRLNRAHSIAFKLSDFLLYNENMGGIVNNLKATSFPGVAYGSPTWVATPLGPALSCAGSQSIDIANHTNYAAGDLTVEVMLTPISWPGTYTPIFDKGVGGNRELALYIDTSGNTSYYGIGDSSSGIAIPLGLTPGVRAHVVMTRIGSLVSLYKNGQLYGTWTATGTTGQSSVLSFGRQQSSGASGDPVAIYELARTWGRGLVQQEVEELAFDPFCMLNPPNARRWYGGASGPVVVNGTATLAGVGNLQASGVARVFGQGSFVGVSSLAAAGIALLNGSVGLNGIGILTPAGVVVTQATANMMGVGALTAGGSTGSAALAVLGIAALSATGQIVSIGSAILSGVGVMSATGQQVQQAQVSLVGCSLLVATGSGGATVPLIIVSPGPGGILSPFTFSGGLA